MLSKLVFSFLTCFLLVGNLSSAAPWNSRANLEQSRTRNPRGSLPNRGSAAYFGIQPKSDQNTPLHSSVKRAALDNRATPSSRGRGGASTARTNIYQTPGEKLKEQQFVRYGYLTDQRSTALYRGTIEFSRQQAYNFTLDPNPTFKPFILQSEWGRGEDYEFRLWNPYSSGLFHKFGQEKD